MLLAVSASIAEVPEASMWGMAIRSPSLADKEDKKNNEKSRKVIVFFILITFFDLLYMIIVL
jgi:hypothetical protein